MWRTRLNILRCLGRKYYVLRQGLRTLLPWILFFLTYLYYSNLKLLFQKFATFFQMNGNQRYWPEVITNRSPEKRLHVGVQQNKKAFTDDRSRANPRILVDLETSMFKIFVLLHVSHQNKTTLNLDFRVLYSELSLLSRFSCTILQSVTAPNILEWSKFQTQLRNTI